MSRFELRSLDRQRPCVRLMRVNRVPFMFAFDAYAVGVRARMTRNAWDSHFAGVSDVLQMRLRSGAARDAWRFRSVGGDARGRLGRPAQVPQNVRVTRSSSRAGLS